MDDLRETLEGAKPLVTREDGEDDGPAGKDEARIDREINDFCDAFDDTAEREEDAGDGDPTPDDGMERLDESGTDLDENGLETRTAEEAEMEKTRLAMDDLADVAMGPERIDDREFDGAD